MAIAPGIANPLLTPRNFSRSTFDTVSIPLTELGLKALSIVWEVFTPVRLSLVLAALSLVKVRTLFDRMLRITVTF